MAEVTLSPFRVDEGYAISKTDRRMRVVKAENETERVAETARLRGMLHAINSTSLSVKEGQGLKS
ncbi:hypothetical protein Hypma_003975 [Hypsizygus marmoreus]|uniref:Uncharacterized protein n=1 Tax=Hypsizygus marmoreus TaxID=39966 RepID=A0A369J115_HYPMA|nr:hypothetical protein Hypma_003975 [Hypsizygus marmoreus]